MAGYIEKTRLLDQADLLTTYEEKIVEERLDEISEEWQYDVVVMTTEQLNGLTVKEFADNIYDKYEYGYGPDNSGTILVISMAERDWYIRTIGEVNWVLDEAALDDIATDFLPDLSAGNYMDAFLSFADGCSSYFEYDVVTSEEIYTQTVQQPHIDPMWIPGSLLIGFLIALIPVSIMKGQLKSVRSVGHAGRYVKEGSFQLQVSRDLYLYRHVTKQPRPKDQAPKGGGRSGGHSGGGSRGGMGGKF